MKYDTDCRTAGEWTYIHEAPVVHVCTESDPCDARRRA